MAANTGKAGNGPGLFRFIPVLPISFNHKFLYGGLNGQKMAVAYEGITVKQWFMDVARVRLGEMEKWGYYQRKWGKKLRVLIEPFMGKKRLTQKGKEKVAARNQIR